jgi:short-subunit dehydrogenase
VSEVGGAGTVGSNTRVLLTGASSGIGAALARLLASRGATVGLVARREDRLTQVLAQCRDEAPASRAWVADLSDLDRAGEVATEAWDALGHIDVLVNNAGMPKRRHVTRLTAEEVAHVLRVNFEAPVRMTLTLLPSMLERGEGTIVNVSSLAGRLGVLHEAAYCASKFALCGWSEALAIDLSGTGIRVRLVNPGPIDTEIWSLPGNEDPIYDGPKVPALECAQGVLDALESETFEHYVPDLAAIVEGKTAAVDQFIAGSAAMERARARPTRP